MFILKSALSLLLSLSFALSLSRSLALSLYLSFALSLSRSFSRSLSRSLSLSLTLSLSLSPSLSFSLSRSLSLSLSLSLSRHVRYMHSSDSECVISADNGGRTKVIASSRATSRFLQSAPQPNLTSSTKAVNDSAAFFEIIDADGKICIYQAWYLCA